MKYQFIAIEGPIGVGKSTLARQLAKTFKADFLPDADVENPYLKPFYRDPEAVAFHAQMHFLVSRLQVLRNPAVVNPTQPIVADFMIDKDAIFAELTLDRNEWWMYSQIYEQQIANLPQPDLVIYLQAPLERLIQRIERRGLSHEQRIGSHYLQQLSHRYEAFFHAYTRTPLLIVNTADINLADDPAEVSRLAGLIREFEGGRHYFNPLALDRA